MKAAANSLKLFVLCLWMVGAQANCPLCGDATIMPKNWLGRIDNGNGPTCKQLFFDMFQMAQGSECDNKKHNYQVFCCGETAPTVASDTYEPISYDGDEPVCPICTTVDVFPGAPTEMISAMYVGTYSCNSLYYRGIGGMIPQNMCEPLKGYAWNACKCMEGGPPPGNTTSTTVTSVTTSTTPAVAASSTPVGVNTGLGTTPAVATSSTPASVNSGLGTGTGTTTGNVIRGSVVYGGN